ncbi:hypothetical protein D6C79_10047 [Aureobasidium pullulans]|nr:hypothetical protein D6C79_10047 [Aureobasidium pullulans]
MSQDFEWIQLATAPFGLYTTQQWDLWDYNKEPNYDSSGYIDPDDSDSDNATGVRVKDENDPPHKPSQRYFPIPQAWCGFLFSDDSWADQVMKYGLAAIKVPKIEKWKVIRYHSGDTGYWDTGEDRWNGGDEDDDLGFSGPHWDVGAWRAVAVAVTDPVFPVHKTSGYFSIAFATLIMKAHTGACLV